MSDYTQVLQNELKNEISINQMNERRICRLIKDLAQCEKEIARKYEHIEHNEKECACP